MINISDFQNQLQNSLSFSAGIPLRFKTAEEAELEALESVGPTAEN